MRAPSLMEPRVRHSAVVEVAGLVCRIECRHLKPIAWARDAHPVFLSAKPPEVELVIVYDDGYWGQGLPWVAPNTVPEVPRVTREAHTLGVRTAYYRATIDDRAGRIDVRMASGFRVDGLLRTLYALLLPARGALLVRATRVTRNGSSVLLVGPPAAGAARPNPAAGDGGIFAGFVAVAGIDGRYLALTTPFNDGDPRDEEPTRLPLDALHFVEREAGASTAIAPAEAARRLLPHVCVVERTVASLERVLELSAWLVQTLPCERVSEVSRLESDRHAAHA